MPRERLTWAQHETLIRRYLGDTEEPYVWSSELLMQGWNASMDERAMELGLSEQFYTLRRFVDDLVAGQAFYALPADAARVMRVVRIFTDRGGEERELHYDERVSGHGPAISSAGPDYLPTYRFVGNYLRLDPAPQVAEVGGIAIEAEVAEEGFTGDDSVLPLTWPIFAEELLRIDTALYVFEQEQEEGGSRGGAGDPSVIGLVARRSRYERKLADYLSRRHRSPSQIARFTMGA